jgi:hypothetical protein
VSRRQPKSIPEVLSELWELLIAYGKQETVEPLKGLGRYIGFGVAAALVGSAGILLLMLSLLRLLETHTDGHLGGDWNWVPYVGGLVFLLALVAVFITRIKPKQKGTAKT